MPVFHPIATLESLEALGQYLREIRESEQYSLEQAARLLHIRPTYLKALESGNWSSLPGQAYGRGYLRSYAVLLGISGDEVMEVCDRIQGKISTRLHYFETSSTEEHPSRRILWISAALLIALSVGWYYERTVETVIMPYYSPTPVLEEESEENIIYPLAAQECMKLLQKPQDPCYWVREEKKMPVLAQWPVVSDQWSGVQAITLTTDY